ncbi:MAG: hypothetical protein GY934_09740 [Gammaproteobacteria bacterium]|nr:hypothetical protein [Gammaproteobacteria bacterium]
MSPVKEFIQAMLSTMGFKTWDSTEGKTFWQGAVLLMAERELTPDDKLKLNQCPPTGDQIEDSLRSKLQETIYGPVVKELEHIWALVLMDCPGDAAEKLEDLIKDMKS